MESVDIQFFEKKKLIEILKEFLEVAINTGMDYKISLIDDDANLCFEIPDSLKKQSNRIIPDNETPRLRFSFFNDDINEIRMNRSQPIQNHQFDSIGIYSWDPLLILLFVNNLHKQYPCFKFINCNQIEIPIKLLLKNLEERNSAFMFGYINESGDGYIELPDYHSKFIIKEEKYFKFLKIL